MCRPIGVPTAGAPEPATNGYRPHSCTVVPWYSTPASTCATRPPSGSRQPQPGGTAASAPADPTPADPAPADPAPADRAAAARAGRAVTAAPGGAARGGR